MPSSKRKFVFVLKLLLGMVPLIVFYCFARFYADGYMDGEWPMYKQVKNYINKTGQYNDFLIMGDSTSKFNLNAEALSSEECSVWNIALGGATVIENYLTLKTYLEKGNTTKCIILAFAPVHYFWISDYTTRAEYFNQFSVKDIFYLYKFATHFKDDIDVKKVFFNDEYSFGMLKPIQAAIFYPPKYLASMNNSHFINRFKYNTSQFSFYERTRGSNFTSDYINPRPSYENMPSFVPQKIQECAMKKILCLCKKNNIHVIIEQSPLPEIAYPTITKSFEYDYFSWLNSFRTEFPDMQCVGGFTYYNNNYFVDAAHMNNNGNAAWTQYIKEKYIEPYIRNKKTVLEEEK